MIKDIARKIKSVPLQLLFGRWRQACPFEDGYTAVLPSPMDMPFMLRLGLEGLRRIDTTNCRQILVVPDGWGNDDAAGLKQIIAEFDDPRIELVQLRPLDYRVIRMMRPPGCASTHWMMVVNGTLHARCEYAFLHDSDAFFLEPEGLERQYHEAKQHGMFTYGVEPRWDPFFTEKDYHVPGTWELMYSTRWARNRSPMYLKPGVVNTPNGEFGFDSMLYAQYLDHASGKIGVMSDPPEFVHFNGTIFTYRLFRDSNGRPVTDELFRVLLLSLIESAMQVPTTLRACPSIDELTQGLTSRSARVLYRSDVNQRGYGEFRTMIDKMCDAPIFIGERASKIRELIEPFDTHFGFTEFDDYGPALAHGDVRTAGIR